jgi:cytochrome c553
MKTNKIIYTLIIISLNSISFAQSSLNLEAVKNLVITCTGCHGPEGISANPLWPNLAGQKKDYLSKQILAFKNGERKDPLMNPIASSISEKDIDLIADYYANLK